MFDRFWQDLKRRRVFRVAAAYVAVAFAGLEGAELILPRVGFSDRVLTVLVFLAILGFPLIVVLAWLFELTPEGLVRVAPDTETSDEGEMLDADRRRPLRYAMLAAATVVFAAAALFWIPRTPAFRGVSVDPSALVVLPFDVRGSEDVAYLREGMVDLLSTKLDGVGGLRVVDPQATLARFRDDGQAAPSGDAARRASAALGAGRAMHGSVVWAGGGLQVRATVLGPDEGDRVVASAEGSPDELFDLVDELVGSLVAGGLLVDEVPLSSLEGLTTSSTEALRLYLDGVRDFRLVGGNRHSFGLLDSAVVLDSTFALAAYWAGFAAEFSEVADPVPFYELATRHQGRLRTRDRLRLAAALAGAEGRHGEATALYMRLTERYPDDVASWFQLGEQLAHTGDLTGRTLDEALPVYVRALELDPGLAPAYYHLAHILGLRGDTAGLSTWAARAGAAGVDSLWVALPEMLRGLIVGDTALTRRSFAVYRAAESTLPPATISSSLSYLMNATLEYAPSASLARMYEFADGALTDTARVVARRRASRLEAGAGRFEAAERALPEAPMMPASVRAQDLAWIALHPAATSRERVLRAFDGLHATRPPEGSGEAAVRAHLLGRLALASGRPDEVDEARAALASFVASTPEVERFASDLARELDALAAYAAGDAASALEILLRASYWERTPEWIGFPDGSFWWGRQADATPAFLRAEFSREAGLDEEADLWYRVAADGIWYRASSFGRLADMRESAGDTAGAAALHRRVAALRAIADPEVASAASS